MSAAIAHIADERARQIELGWTPEHDDEHGVEHLVRLASDRLAGDRPELVEAAALLVAAIECLDRMENGR